MSNYSLAHVCHCLTSLSTIRRNSPVTIDGNRRKTGRQFVEGVVGLAHGLRELGLRPGDVVVISSLNSDLYLEWLLAVAFVGGIAAPLNYRWSLEEAKSAMEVVAPTVLVTDTSDYWHSHFQTDSIPSLRWRVLMDVSEELKSQKNILTTHSLKKSSLKSLSLNYMWAPQGAAMICFTSGSTGRPKGVTISHAALLVQSLAKIAIVGYSDDDVILHTAPLCHIGGISSSMAMLMAGGCHVFVAQFKAEAAVEAIELYHVTSFITVPTIMADLTSLIRTKQAWKGLETVKKILNGGGGLSLELIRGATKIFPNAKLLSAYGMTEACSSLTFMTLYDPTCANQSCRSFNLVQQGSVCVGKPAPHVEVMIDVVDSSDVGRILTRGPHVMLGYWGDIPTKARDPAYDGWLDTGDIGHIDDCGNLWLIGRTKGKIKTGGENVYPEEVEAVLLQHPGVFGIVVVGIPDTRLTEMVVACIRLKNSWHWADLGSDHSANNKEHFLSTELLQQFCREKNLTGFKIPQNFIVWRNSFPLTSSGKLRREQVRREVVSQMQLLPSRL